MNKLLFWDDRDIERQHATRRVPQKPRKHSLNPLLCGSALMNSPETVLYDEEERLFKLWYLSLNDAQETVLTYWISQDGVSWEAPNVELFPEPGMPNIVMKLGTYNLGTPRIIKLDRPEDADSRYAMLFYSMRNGQRGVGLARSPDGLRWSKVNDGEFVFQGHDFYNWMRDPDSGLYRCYHIRLAERGAAPYTARDNVPHLRRIVGLKTSENMETWFDHGTILDIGSEDPIDLQHYGFMVAPYEGGYIGLSSAYYTESQLADIAFLFSWDGIHWDKRHACLGGDVFIPRGEGEAFDSGFLYPAQSMVRAGDQLYFYYGGLNRPHNWVAWHEQERFFYKRLLDQQGWEKRLGGYPVYGRERVASAYRNLELELRKRLDIERAGLRRGMGLAVLRIDGFIALQNEAGMRAGLLTKPLVWNGGAAVNADCTEGFMDVAIVDDDGMPLPGFEAERCRLEGVDGTRLALSWTGADPVSLRGRRVRLSVTLFNCRLYSISLDL